MKLEDALKKQRKDFEGRMTVRVKKGEDYAGDTDCLQNFKKVAQLMKILDIDPTTSYGIAMTYAILKIDRLCNLVYRKQKATPSNESIVDTKEDLQNYLDLFDECLTEEFNVGKSDSTD